MFPDQETFVKVYIVSKIGSTKMFSDQELFDNVFLGSVSKIGDNIKRLGVSLDNYWA